MHEPADLHFARWCRTADPAALGELFDATAPRLLRLAIHLVGDAATAEDLVQQTYLAALEQRARLDGARPVWPWLTGVLANLAKKHQRRAGRERELEPVLAAAEDPSRPLERRELDGEIARAIDELGEPYREVVLLRLRHGLEPADIAHVLTRDAGTVRVQLHRGLEKLRASLPASVVGALALAWLAPRGLAAVRGELVAAASAAAVVGSTSLVLGGGLVVKKLFVAAAVVLGLVALWSVLPERPEDAVDAPVTSAPLSAELAPVADAPAPSSPLATTPVGHSGGRESSSTTSALHAGPRVVDAETGAPIANAQLALYPPRRALALELLAATPELYELGATGELQARGGNDWPLVVAPSAAARFGREALTAFDRPRAGEAPLARTSSDADGFFELPADAGEFVLEGSAPGYATRWKPVQAGTELATLELWREREVHGQVFLHGEPLTEPIELVLIGHFMRLPPLPEDGSPPARPQWSHGKPEGLGVWVVRSGSDGRFEARVGAAHLQVRTLTAELSQSRPSVGDVAQELQVFLEDLPTFRITDAASGAPIERVRLLARQLDQDYPRWTGEFSAPAGLLKLPTSFAFLRTIERSAYELEVWSEGYAASTLSLANLDELGPHEVRLAAGATPTLTGRILFDGAPLAGAEVALLAYRALSWDPSEDSLIDAVSTDSSGEFRLNAPPGDYLLRARTDGGPFLEQIFHTEPFGSMVERPRTGHEPWFERVTLPAARPLVLDLARGSRIDVELVDSDGRPRADYQIVLSGSDGRGEWHETDAEGRVSFVRLPAGSYRISLPPNGERRSFSGGLQRELTLDADQREAVRFELAPAQERHGRIAARGVSDFTGWRARLEDGDWLEVAYDGALPMTLDPGHYSLEVLAPDERHWVLSLPETLADGHVFELDLGDLAFTGELLHADGTPWSDVRVYIETDQGDNGSHRVVDVTDATGRFELRGFGAPKPLLEFHTNLERRTFDSFGNELEGYQFEPEMPASEAGTWLSLRVPAPGPMRIRGTLVDARGQVLPKKRVWMDGHTPATGGRWHVRGANGSTTIDSRGGFDLTLPAAPSVHVRVWDEETRTLLLDQESAVTGAELELDLRVP